MINPILFTGKSGTLNKERIKWLADNNDKPLFYLMTIIDDVVTEQKYLGVLLSGNKLDWFISSLNGVNVFHRDNMSKEVGIQFIMDNYPECYEWLLWNPEWLK